jgi:hypothetical protein
MVDAILQSKCHVVVTMRSKMEYVQEKNSDGRTVINKVGMAPIQRSGMEYEFTIVGDMSLDNSIVISKSRYEPFSGRVQKKPGIEFFKPFVDWLDSGETKDTTTTTTPRVEAEPEPAQLMSRVASEPKPEPVIEKPSPSNTMTIEDACKVETSDNPPKRYGDLPIPELSARFNELSKQLKGNSLDPAERASKDYKAKAAQMVITAKVNKEI